MRPNAIYSKSGKGVQEASGKTSLLKREHRAVLAAIDGRATLADVAQKSGNEYDAGFQQLIIQLDKDGFIREVSSGAAAGPAAGAAKPAGKPDTAIDLDFSSLASSQKANTAPQPTRPPPPAPKAPAVDVAAKAAAERRAKEQESTLHRARQEAEEKALAERERHRAEAEAKVRAETEARLRVEAEKKLREEAAHKVRAEATAKAQADAEARAKAAREAAARIAAEQKAKAEAELRAKLDAERKARQEAERRIKEEAERARREAEEKARREAAELRQQIEEERKAREEAERRAREEMNRARSEADERARRAEERKHKQPEPPAEAPPPPPRPQPQAAPGSDKFADSLFADLDSFNKREEEGRRDKEEEERLARENEERERKFREEEDKRARESEERARKAKEEEILAAKTRGGVASGGDSSLQDRRAKAMKRGPGVAAAHRRHERNWGKPVAITLLVILGGALGALHVISISTADYEKAAREALGQPVRLASGRISLLRGVHYEFKDVRIGERVRIAEARAFPALDALFDEKKVFKRVELEGAAVPQDMLGEAVFARANGENFTLGRVVAKQLKLEGPLPLPPLDVDVALDATGMPRVASLAGPENLVANLASRGAELEFEMSASSFALPIAPALSLDQFGMKGTLTRRGMNISSWDEMFMPRREHQHL